MVRDPRGTGFGLEASPPWSWPTCTAPEMAYTVPSRLGTTRLPVIICGRRQARSEPSATVPTLAKPVGQSSAGPPVGGGAGGGGAGGGGAVGGGGGNAPSPGDATRSAPLPQALRASAAPKVISRVR